MLEINQRTQAALLDSLAANRATQSGSAATGKAGEVVADFVPGQQDGTAVMARRWHATFSLLSRTSSLDPEIGMFAKEGLATLAKYMGGHDEKHAGKMAQPDATPVVVMAQPDATPVEAMAQPDATPADVMVDPDATPVEAMAQPAATPADVMVDPAATPADVMVDPAAKRVTAMVDPATPNAEPTMQRSGAKAEFAAKSAAAPLVATARLAANPSASMIQSAVRAAGQLSTQRAARRRAGQKVELREPASGGQLNKQVASGKGIFEIGFLVFEMLTKTETSQLTAIYNEMKRNNSASENATKYADLLNQQLQVFNTKNNSGGDYKGPAFPDPADAEAFYKWAKKVHLKVGGKPLTQWLKDNGLGYRSGTGKNGHFDHKKFMDGSNFTADNLSSLASAVTQLGSQASDSNQSLSVKLQQYNGNISNDETGESSLIQQFVTLMGGIASKL